MVLRAPHLALIAGLVTLLVAGCGPAPWLAPDTPVQAAPVDPAMTSGEWTAFAHDPGGSQFSPLAGITATNVQGLRVAWRHNSGDVKAGQSARTGTSFEATPIVVNGLLYYCTPMNRVFALDPATGRQRWVFDPFAIQPDGAPVSRDGDRLGVCRGVAYWRSASRQEAGPCLKRIFRGDRNGRLYAIDADTGRACRGFGPAAHPGYVSHRDFDNHGEGSVGMTSPPVVVGDTVIVGIGSTDGIQDAGDGIVRAFDARSGALKWEFNAIPEAYRRRTGAANVWSTLSVDVKNGLVFVPTTSPSTDYYGGARRFDMPLTNALVALRAETGAVAWSFQTLRHDLWDYDLPGHPLLVTIVKDGRARDVAIQQTKTGHLFVLDRLTGRPVFPVVEQAAPASPLPDDAAAPTQPIPQIAPFARTAIRRGDLFGVALLDKLWCQRRFDEARYQGLFTAPGTDWSIQVPATMGGGNWGGAAFDPSTNSLIVKSNNLATRLRFIRKGPGAPQPQGLIARTQDGPYMVEGDIFVSPLGLPCTPPPFGQLSSIDMATGKVRWTRAVGQARAHGVTAPGFLNWGSPNLGGPIVTGGGLVFFSGGMDSAIRAFDVRTGKALWKAPLPAPGMATPMTYRIGGRQYVVVAAGGNATLRTQQSDALVAFALP